MEERIDARFTYDIVDLHNICHVRNYIVVAAGYIEVYVRHNEFTSISEV